jgi:hypothetical protein
MSLLMTLTVGLAAANGLAALVLAIVYARNHGQMRSPFTLGLLLFAVFLVVHSGVLVYTDLTMMATYTPRAEMLHLATTGLESAALATLTWATLR